MIGSLRSPIPLKDILNKCEYVDFASGHNESCGVGLRAENIDKLKEYLDSLNLSYSTDTEVLLSSTVKNIPKRLFSEFEPYTTLWGKGLEKPLFHIKPFTINSNDIKVLGANKRTLKFSKDGVDFLIFMCTNEQKERIKQALLQSRLTRYQGTFTEGARKRLSRCIDIMIQTIKSKTVWNEVTQRYQKHRLSFITLTIPDKTELTVAKSVAKKLTHLLNIIISIVNKKLLA